MVFGQGGLEIGCGDMVWTSLMRLYQGVYFIHVPHCVLFGQWTSYFLSFCIIGFFRLLWLLTKRLFRQGRTR
jgi:hypothetical protein